MIPSEQIAVERLRSEYNVVSHDREPRIEYLGKTARVYIDTPFTQENLNLLSRLFCISAKDFCKGWDTADDTAKAEFMEGLACLRILTEENLFLFTADELDTYLTRYSAEGYPAVSHSVLYRNTYMPAYRVIDTRFARIFDLLGEIGERLAEKDRVIIAIDGRCASGKTTMADWIARIFPASVIHMDDFFLPGELRTPERMAEVGGNLHRERFMEEVIPHLHDDRFSYRVFQCSTFTYADTPRVVEGNRVLICEGSYALHPDFGKYYDIAVFSDIDPEEQLRRILERDGEFMLNRFRNEWIPMEEKYFTGMGIRGKCDCIL